MRAIIVGAVLLSSIGLASATPKHHHRHAQNCCTEYRGYYGYIGPDGYRVWEGDVDPSFGSERYGENGGTTHYGE